MVIATFLFLFFFQFCDVHFERNSLRGLYRPKKKRKKKKNVAVSRSHATLPCTEQTIQYPNTIQHRSCDWIT